MVTAATSSKHVAFASLFLLVCGGILTCEGKPANSHPDLDPVDICIFTCDYCYKGMFLVKCANECMAQDGEVSAIWHRECPYFGKPMYFD